MSFDLKAGSEGASAAPAAAGGGSAAGKLTLSSMLPGAQAEASGGEVRAMHGTLAEGSHPGVRKGGGKAKRAVGVISGGSFQKASGPAAAGAVAGAAAAGPAAAARPAATAHEGERAYTGDSGHKQADREVSDGTTNVSMEDESDAQALVISAAVTRARAMLDNAIGKLGTPSAAQVSTALQNNFHSTEEKTSSEVLSKLQRIRSAFDGTIPIEVETEDDGTRAYVYAIWSDIHLCQPWFADSDPDGRARTIIHECSHKYTGTDDKAYHWDSAKYGGLSTKDALNNADSYAWFCIDVR